MTAPTSSPSVDGIAPTELDILCGKTKFIINHPGTIRYNKIVDSFTQRYIQAETKFDKMGVTKSLHDYLKTTSRFLKQNSEGQWEEITPLAARDKIGHALRFAVKAVSNDDNKKPKRKSRRGHRRVGSDWSAASINSIYSEVSTNTAATQASDPVVKSLAQNLSTNFTIDELQTNDSQHDQNPSFLRGVSELSDSLQGSANDLNELAKNNSQHPNSKDQYACSNNTSFAYANNQLQSGSQDDLYAFSNQSFLAAIHAEDPQGYTSNNMPPLPPTNNNHQQPQSSIDNVALANHSFLAAIQDHNNEQPPSTQRGSIPPILEVITGGEFDNDREGDLSQDHLCLLQDPIVHEFDGLDDLSE